MHAADFHRVLEDFGGNGFVVYHDARMGERAVFHQVVCRTHAHGGGHFEGCAAVADVDEFYRARMQ